MDSPCKEGVEILKSTWSKDKSSNWRINELRSLKLKPRANSPDNYFHIDNSEISFPQMAGPMSLEFLSLFGTPEFVLRQSIVPIVAWNNGDDEARCIGTGFFISASGYLMTAAHVIRDPVDENYTSITKINKGIQKLGEELRFGVLLPANPAIKTAPINFPHPTMREANWFMCPFEWTQQWGNMEESPFPFQEPNFKLGVDVAICKVWEQPAIGPFQPLNIGIHGLNVGDRAVAIGYPEMENIRLRGDDNQPELMVSVGSVTKIHRDNITIKQNSTPGPNFQFNAKIPGKMSGSPILVGEGIMAKGVVSRSWGDEPDASGCLIAPAFGLRIGQDRTLLDLMTNGNEGIPEIHGHGL